MGSVVFLHPKFVKKWALRYMVLYRTKGAEVAKDWALAFLPPDSRQAMIDQVNKILKKNKKGPGKGPGED